MLFSEVLLQILHSILWRLQREFKMMKETTGN